MKNDEKLDFDKVWLMFQETDKKFKETDLKFKETDAEFKQMQREYRKMIKELKIQIGGLGNSFGRYTEGLLGPSIRKILEKKFGAEYVTGSLKRKLNGQQFEIDYFGACNGNEQKAYVVEVKTNLKQEHINQLMKTVKLLPKIMPEQKGKKIYGIMAAVSFTEEQRQKILESGFYFMKITDELANLDIPRNFKPKAY